MFIAISLFELGGADMPNLNYAVFSVEKHIGCSTPNSFPLNWGFCGRGELL